MRYEFKAAEEIMWGATLAFLTAFCSTYVAGQGMTDKTTLLLTATAAGGRPAVAYIATALTTFLASTRDSFFAQIAKYAPQAPVPTAPPAQRYVDYSPYATAEQPIALRADPTQSAIADQTPDMAPPPPPPNA